MPIASFAKVLKKELLDKRFWQETGLSDEIIPQDAFFQHVRPFMSNTQLTREDIVRILKADERFKNKGCEAESEVRVFAEILYRASICEDEEHELRIEVNGFFKDLKLTVNLNQSRRAEDLLDRLATNLEAILSGKFSLSLEEKCNPNFWKMALGSTMSLGLAAGGSYGVFYLLRNLIHWHEVGDIVALGISSFMMILFMVALVVATIFSIYEQAEQAGYCQPRGSLDDRVFSPLRQSELLGFFKKYEPAPTVSVPQESTEPHDSSKTPLLSAKSASYGAAEPARYGASA